MSKASNIVELHTYRFSIDWTYEEKVEINLDDYVFFECDYRLSDWHLIGHMYDKETEKWSTKELSAHWCFERDIADFIFKANKYDKSKDIIHRQGCKVSRFNNLHYSNGFYKSLQTIFKMVEQMESEETE